jgi:D-alanyl-D-alanine-carboxypeptidase/D-alanyl-D-alanine-endopeptidase
MPFLMALGLLLSGCPCEPFHNGAPTTLEQLVDQQVGSIVEANKAAGIAVAVVRGDAVDTFYYGETVLGEGQAPNARTEFEIGSVTKTFTGALFALMIADGVVALDTPLQGLLPAGVRSPTFQGQQIVLGDLASHISGLPGLPSNLVPLPISDPYKNYTLEKLYAFLNGYELTRAPQSAYEYSNLGMALLGHALELKAGKPYAQLIEERILTPLGLDDTAVELDAEQAQRLAAPYSAALLSDFFCVKPREASNWNIGIFAPAGALRSTLTDMAAYLKANRDATTNALASAAGILYTPRATASDKVRVALAWHRAESPRGLDIVWHNGETGAYCSFLGFVPETGTGIVILANTSAALYTDIAAINILDGLAQLP